MKTFNEFLEILQEKKKNISKKQLTQGIVVNPDVKREPDGTIQYNLSDFQRPVPTRPNSPQRRIQTKKLKNTVQNNLRNK